MPKLLTKEGPGKGDAIELTQKEVTIGRDLGNTLSVADRTVSRFHARMVEGDGSYYVCDLGSHNGTLVNGERVRRRKLFHMDEVRLGNLVLIFLEEDVTDMDLLVRPEQKEPEITQTILLDEPPVLDEMAGLSRKELTAANERLLALTELSQAATTVKSLPSLFDLLADSMSRTLEPDRVAPIVRQEDGTLLPYIRAKSGFAKGLEGAGISKAAVEHCLQKGVAVLSQAPREALDQSPTDRAGQQITSVLCAPLLTPSIQRPWCFGVYSHLLRYSWASVSRLCGSHNMTAAYRPIPVAESTWSSSSCSNCAFGQIFRSTGVTP